MKNNAPNNFLESIYTSMHHLEDYRSKNIALLIFMHTLCNKWEHSVGFAVHIANPANPANPNKKFELY